ncbi:hypothetical protein L915_06216 [Plasmopara halstedii]|uniref:Uncharacterized protein n=1 Tax=Plasmopara halstedii TaxID=4781 RepID=A0A0P1B6M0_PLAHL|nr:hypothetical protein L915_06216 [Plasmopara halstedii]CEG49231.1 hypothetical protein L915_06216 [Plasmopara halstedii]|eukprot:XP_024585600.1 hypothetical protein L915_06216 [Plasmopara halstedii]
MSMHDHVQKTRHHASYTVSKVIVMASQVHVFGFGMCEGTTGYCLTRAKPSTLEEAFAFVLLRTTWWQHSMHVHCPLKLGNLRLSQWRSTSSMRQTTANIIAHRNSGRGGRSLNCFCRRKVDHRAPALAAVLAHADAEPVSADQPKFGLGQ